jgi:polar amino acid transport system substrate-binding protein
MSTVQVTPDIVKSLAPTGKLRATINLGNMVLAQGTPAAPRGITVDISNELGRRLGVPVEFNCFDAAGKAFENFKSQGFDIVFLAIEPVRAADVDFTAPYVIIEGVYMVPMDSKLKAVADVDSPGVRIAVAKDAAYDLFLTRSLKHATLVRGPESFEQVVRGTVDAAGGVKQPLVAFAKAHADKVRVLDGRFMEIRQAMGTQKGREAGAKYLRAFIEELKASGFIADGLKRSNQPDATVAPAG